MLATNTVTPSWRIGCWSASTCCASAGIANSASTQPSAWLAALARSSRPVWLNADRSCMVCPGCGGTPAALPHDPLSAAGGQTAGPSCASGIADASRCKPMCRGGGRPACQGFDGPARCACAAGRTIGAHHAPARLASLDPGLAGPVAAGGQPGAAGPAGCCRHTAASGPSTGHSGGRRHTASRRRVGAAAGADHRRHGAREQRTSAAVPPPHASPMAAKSSTAWAMPRWARCSSACPA